MSSQDNQKASTPVTNNLQNEPQGSSIQQIQPQENSPLLPNSNSGTTKLDNEARIGKSGSESQPPSYSESTSNPIVIVSNPSPQTQIDLLLIEGKPFGGAGSFILHFILVSIFDLLGLLVSYFIQKNHTGRLGMLSGFGVLLTSRGFSLRHTVLHHFDDSYSCSYIVNLILAYFLIVSGWCTIYYSIKEYSRVKKLYYELIANPETGISQ